MLSRNILNELPLVLLLSLATVTRSEHYHIVPVNSTDLCHDYRNRTCFTLEELVQTNLSFGGDNLILSFLPGDHVLTEQLLIRNFSHVHITGQNKTSTTVRFYSNGTIHFISTTELYIEHLGFVGAKIALQNSHKGWIIDSAHGVYINDCYFMNFELLNLAEIGIVKISNTHAATIESTLFMNNIGWGLHVEAGDVYITNSKFTKNNGGAVYIQSNNSLINNTEFNYNIAWSGGAVEILFGTVVITWCNFTNNKVLMLGGAIIVQSGSNVFLCNSELTKNIAGSGGAIFVYSDNSVSISNSTLSNNSLRGGDYPNGGAIFVYLGNSVSISNSTLSNNNASNGGGGAIFVYSGNSVSISNSTLANNNAGGGGTIFVYAGSSVSISNSTLSNNNAGEGGAIYVYPVSIPISNNGTIGVQLANVSISNSTLSNNRASRGGAIQITASGSLNNSASVSISGSILTNNRAKKDGGAISVNSGNIYTSPTAQCQIIVLQRVERLEFTKVVRSSPTVS